MQREYVDNYCERTDGSFWSEPLNAVSNVSFLIASIAAWLFVRRAVRASGRQAGELSALPVLIFVIFFGSSAFHTTATRWGLVLDSGSIAVFMVYFIALWARLYWDLPWSRAWIAAPVFLAFTGLISLLPIGMPGTYLAAVLGLVVLAGLLFFSRHEDRKVHWPWYLGAAAVFAVALTARTLDQPLCDEMPIGTHYIWHTLNGVVLYLVTHAAVVRWRETASREPQQSR